MPRIVAEVVAATVVVFIVNTAVVAPAATVTLAGTVALVALEESDTTAPPVGAGPLKVTVPVDGDPPATEVGDRLNDATEAGLIVTVALAETALSVPVISAATAAVTGAVVTVNVAEYEPAAIVTVAGTAALLLFEARLTINPPLGAGPVSVAVPVEALPPVTVVGASESELKVAGVIPKVALSEVVPRVAVRVAVVDAVTDEVVTVNVVLLAPCGMVTVVGTPAFELLEDTATFTPAPEAGPDKVRVPVDVEPPTTEVGETVKLLSVTAWT